MNKDLKSFFILISSSLILLFLLSSFFAYVYFNLSEHLSPDEQTELFIGVVSVLVAIFVILYLFAQKFLFPLLNLNALVLAQKTGTAYDESATFFNDETSVIEEHLIDLKKEVDVDTNAIEKLSLVDPLTGINNRHYFFEFGERIFKLAKRNREPLSIIIFEIDNLETMVQKYGQKTGDDSLAILSQETQQFLRKSDIFSRYSETELIILLPQTSGKDSLIVAQKIQNSLDTPDFKHHSKTYFTVSIGISSLHEGDIFLRDIVQRSLSELIKAKKLNPSLK